ncbi:MAG: molecular chaperone DnaJ [Alphaproteobacteria bacterium]|uniref:molecular chaperone DnaJ n=1 Tax=Brevundimonas sp. TaxID=1871086 RepID=UPI0018521131|nr:molecular chaperone DnaJ [Brevundimonas sp.]MBA3051308.1 molecular chaperone DnaJ [Brevundimonas sp.]MBU3973465.1 molecular chaperone DnaJ [Alphaproteobacteria bacterium]MBU4038569.1 molecular chaperone DnaJ [Alphaproteobacteria bacterium]
MNLAWLVLAGIAVWALVRLGRQGERRGRAQWRVAATLFSAVMLGAGALLAFRGAWLPAVGLIGAGLWLTLASRQRTVAPRAEDMSPAEARSLLGVSAAATPQEINAAWKRLMGRAHPDQGGTEGLASRLNAARDRLLKG